ncbi:MerR family transcriptional regulator [Lentzea sp.]|uniref:MerR family transcriptional regulator n=1 Tax=Lentzea sp. TaxID=56099 RepID=UPI002CFC7964|nr:MerR family transcriptional regulator [Lentzea sp.]HUQ56314.1 MerR family transcriptional regulator [Lentzea sp.]
MRHRMRLSCPVETMTIGAVAEQLGVATSTLRWWEKRGLISPRDRRVGRRYYNHTEVRRLAIIQLLQETGLMSLDDIAALLADHNDNQDWHDVVHTRIDSISIQIEQLTAAKAYLEHTLRCHRDNFATECPYLRDDIDARLARKRGKKQSRTAETRRRSPGPAGHERA